MYLLYRIYIALTLLFSGISSPQTIRNHALPQDKLQASLARDVALGRLGQVLAGDVFVMLDNDNRMTLMLHVVELGGGYLRFQIRGLEFVGTYCHTREIEALEEDQGGNRNLGCCALRSGCWPGSLLGPNRAMALRWRSWTPVSPAYVVPGYSISTNLASTMFNSYDMRGVLLCCLTQALIYYLVAHPRLKTWLAQHAAHLDTLGPQFVAAQYLFNRTENVDYNRTKRGITMRSFYSTFGDWLACCCKHVRAAAAAAATAKDKDEHTDTTATEPANANRNASEDDMAHLNADLGTPLARLALAVSLAARRMLLSRARYMQRVPDAFLHGYYGLFQGLLQPSERDEWLLGGDLDLVPDVIFRGARMALRLHQDYFTDPTEYNDPEALYDALQEYDAPTGMLRLVVCHEGDRQWRDAVMGDHTSLLSLRYNIEDSSNNKEFMVVSLTVRHRTYKVYKVNRESVRGLWAGQQQEVLFFRNPASERGSIQNAMCVLRNMVSQSNDQPVGYPIYVSPIVTSFAEPPPTDGPLTRLSSWLGRMAAQCPLRLPFVGSRQEGGDTEAARQYPAGRTVTGNMRERPDSRVTIVTAAEAAVHDPADNTAAAAAEYTPIPVPAGRGAEAVELQLSETHAAARAETEAATSTEAATEAATSTETTQIAEQLAAEVLAFAADSVKQAASPTKAETAPRSACDDFLRMGARREPDFGFGDGMESCSVCCRTDDDAAEFEGDGHLGLDLDDDLGWHSDLGLGSDMRIVTPTPEDMAAGCVSDSDVEFDPLPPSKWL